MGVKKIARPINKAKNEFVKYLKSKNADDIDEFEGAKDDQWDYYRCVSGFIDDNLLTVYFEMWHGDIKINYSDNENNYNKMTIEEFYNLIN